MRWIHLIWYLTTESRGHAFLMDIHGSIGTPKSEKMKSEKDLMFVGGNCFPKYLVSTSVPVGTNFVKSKGCLDYDNSSDPSTWCDMYNTLRVFYGLLSWHFLGVRWAITSFLSAGHPAFLCSFATLSQKLHAIFWFFSPLARTTNEVIFFLFCLGVWLDLMKQLLSLPLVPLLKNTLSLHAI